MVQFFGKSVLKLGLVGILVSVWSVSVFAAPSKNGFISLSESRKVFYRYYPAPKKDQDNEAPAPEKSTLLLVNGLIYDLDNWNDFIERAHKMGHPVISFAFSAQPESLRGLEGQEPDYFKKEKGLEFSDLTDEIMAVYKKLKKTGKVDLVTLSYGSVGAVFASQNPDKVDHLVMLSPLVVPTDHYDPTGQLYKLGFDWYRLTAPWFDPLGLYADHIYELTYDFVYSWTINQRMGSKETQPGYFPEGVDPKIFKRGVFQLVRAARDFDLKKVVLEPLPETHMVIASLDDRPLLKDQLRVWENLPAKTRGSFTVMDPAYHAMVGMHPAETMEMLGVILGDYKAKLKKGGSYVYGFEKRNLVEADFEAIKKAINSVPQEVQ